MPRFTPEDIRRLSVEELRARAAKRLEELCALPEGERKREREPAGEKADGKGGWNR